ncbi:MAG TPA: gamma-glutamyltransferase, partial [Myxococcota bacterium]|nr:gamma-glutamyltransferase [Myxococcota bacterium]
MRRSLSLALLCFCLFLIATPARSGAKVGAISTDHPLATRVGVDVLARGGNAVDAAVAAALALGVVQPAGSGLGGGGFALVVQKGSAHVLDFRETAPKAATREMFLKEGASSTLGGLAVGTPAEAFGLVELQERFGKLPWSKVVDPARKLAESGFERGEHLAKGLLKNPQMEVLFGEGNRRPGLAAALKSLAGDRGESFRRGWVAKDIVAAVQAAGGLLTEEDLASYQVEERTVLQGAYKGYGVMTMPSPSSGGTALLELLYATEGTTSVQCEVEAAKHAMARRALTAGDVGTGSSPIDMARIAAIRADCGAKTYASDHYGALVEPPRNAGTAHVSVLDGQGLAVALTTTINTSFGSQVVAPKSGILLNNQMDDFTTRPGQPNAFGLVQSEANAIAPGKRPLSSMTPTVLLDEEGIPFLVVGASGGPFIITSTYQVIRNILDHQMKAEEATAAPRWHHQWMPDLVMLEANHPARSTLEEAGHSIKEVAGFSSVQVVYREHGHYWAAADPRKGGAGLM